MTRVAILLLAGWSTTASAQGLGRALSPPHEREEGGIAHTLSAPRVGARTISLRFDSVHRTALHERGGRGYRLLCVAPCSLEIGAGVHHFALSLPGRDPIAAPELELVRSGVLVGLATDNTALRVGGWTISVMGSLVAIGTMIGGIVTIGSVEGDSFTALFFTIAGVHLIAVLAAGIPMAAAGDGLALRFE